MLLISRRRNTERKWAKSTGRGGECQTVTRLRCANDLEIRCVDIRCIAAVEMNGLYSATYPLATKEEATYGGTGVFGEIWGDRT